MVTNGPDKHPGAVAVEDEFGRVISLATFSEQVGQCIVVLSCLAAMPGPYLIMSTWTVVVSPAWPPSAKGRAAPLSCVTASKKSILKGGMHAHRGIK